MADKPPYRVPTMQEIGALPWNGFNVISTFSGCGGSCLGYRMAGFKVLWSSEFIPAAQESYLANAAHYTTLDTRDIREVTPQDIFAATGLAEGEIDILDGSPPCASFSTAGKREQAWGQVKKYSDTQQRVDDLFFEYARLVDGLKPRIFVAENVSGLVKGTAKGYFKQILASLKACGYRVHARLLNASWLGVPQARQRLIFVGVREDLGVDPVHPMPLAYQYSVRDALPWIIAQGNNGGFGKGSLRNTDQPSPTIGADPSSGNGQFPPSRIMSARPNGGAWQDASKPSPAIMTGPTNGNYPYPAGIVKVVHDTSGLHSQGDITERPAPTVSVGVNSLNSNHFQVHQDGADGTPVDPETGERIGLPQKMAAQVVDGATSAGAPAAVCRKLTIAELRRISGFPDDFALTGTYAQRWERIGRAVPPVMMMHISAAVRDQILIPLREQGKI